jgi:hypothetical protein
MSKEITECDLCHSKNIAPAPHIGDKWYQCADCGETMVLDPVQPHAGGLVLEKNPSTGGMSYRPARRREKRAAPVPSPSGSLSP